MQKKTKLIISISAILFFALVYFGYQVIESEKKIIINTPQKNIKINNIYKKPIEEYSNKEIIFKNSPDYSMFYDPQSEWFNITILNPDLQSARDKAEQEFIKTLNIAKDDACLLNVNLGVPFSVNNEASGVNYGLSFCKNGLSFPK